ncbi:hypothetical protein PIB30_117015 [Stylosanthes scabra]|uniref:Uncharacterized protein n=1 Tax=Stylosanthes scabra TaxID=79078 RepID=A0ABU6TTP3_9FABA|nr:hypothetical protein [Stylosanthes scabra]
MMALLLQSPFHLSHSHPNPKPNSPPNRSFLFAIPLTSTLPFNAAFPFSALRTLTLPPLPSPIRRPHSLQTTSLQPALRLAVSALLFLCFSFSFCLLGVRPCSASMPSLATAAEDQTIQDDGDETKQGSEENVELEAAFNTWKSKTFALTVPLKLVALRASLPPSWIKDFINSQGKRLKFSVKYHASLDSIFSDLSIPFTKGNLRPASSLAADIVGIGDSWLKFAIKKAIIEPIRDVEDQDWFKGLDEKWKEL